MNTMNTMNTPRGRRNQDEKSKHTSPYWKRRDGMYTPSPKTEPAPHTSRRQMETPHCFPSQRVFIDLLQTLTSLYLSIQRRHAANNQLQVAPDAEGFAMTRGRLTPWRWTPAGVRIEPPQRRPQW